MSRRPSDIGLCLIVSEGSVASGVRRIEAVTGRGAYELVQKRFRALKEAASLYASTPDEVPQKTQALLDEISADRKQIAALRQELAASTFNLQLENVPVVSGIPVFTATLPGADAEALRQMTDRFRQKYPSGVCVLASVTDGKPALIAAITEDLVKRGLNAGELVKFVAAPLGGGGGGRPTLAQAGGKDASKLEAALASVAGWVEKKLKFVNRLKCLWTNNKPSLTSTRVSIRKPRARKLYAGWLNNYTPQKRSCQSLSPRRRLNTEKINLNLYPHPSHPSQ